MFGKLKYFALVTAVAAGTGGLAFAQGPGYAHEPWRVSDNARGEQAYQEGFAQGQRDRAHHGHRNHRTSVWQHGDREYREAYQRGYEAGYNSDRYPNPAHGAFGSLAYSQGIQDGKMDGQHDRMTGHSYRPTQDDNYRHADRGYSYSMGNKDAYKQQYRNGYMSGYEQGYRGVR